MSLVVLGLLLDRWNWIYDSLHSVLNIELPLPVRGFKWCRTTQGKVFIQ